MCLAEVHSPEIVPSRSPRMADRTRAEEGKLDVTRLMECLPGTREARVLQSASHSEPE